MLLRRGPRVSAKKSDDPELANKIQDNQVARAGGAQARQGLRSAAPLQDGSCPYLLRLVASMAIGHHFFKTTPQGYSFGRHQPPTCSAGKQLVKASRRPPLNRLQRQRWKETSCVCFAVEFLLARRHRPRLCALRRPQSQFVQPLPRRAAGRGRRSRLGWARL